MLNVESLVMQPQETQPEKLQKGGAAGIAFDGTGGLAIIDDTIASNSGDHGGGLLVENGSARVKVGNTVIASNVGTTVVPDVYLAIFFGDVLFGALMFSWPKSQTFTLPSRLTMAMAFPSGENATPDIVFK